MIEDFASSSPEPAGAARIPEDSELLRRYAEEGSETAFAELVRRRIGLVYSVALRQTHGDRHRAEDVTQAVFSDLARKARALAQRPVLAGWLYRSAQFAAAGLVRAEQRRQAREREAQAMETFDADNSPPDWDKVRPVLDHVLSELDDRDRDAILLRYFDNRPFAEIGARLRLTENAARMRVERALDKLNTALTRRGITSTAAAAGAALAQQAGAAAPVGLAASVTAAALAGTAGSAGALSAILPMISLPIGFVGAIVAAGTAALMLQTQTNTALRREVAALHVPPGDVVALRVQNQQLASLASEVKQLRGDDREFKLLAESVAAAQQAQEAHTARLAQQRQTEQNAQSEIDRMNREGNKLVGEYKTLAAEAKDPSLSSEIQAQAEAGSKLKLAEVRAKQHEIRVFIEGMRASLPSFQPPGALRIQRTPEQEAALRRTSRGEIDGDNYAPGTIALRPADDQRASLHFPGVDHATVLSAYEKIARIKIVRDPALATIQGTVDLKTPAATKDETLQVLRGALREQLNIVLEPSNDGALIAKPGPAR